MVFKDIRIRKIMINKKIRENDYRIDVESRIIREMILFIIRCHAFNQEIKNMSNNFRIELLHDITNERKQPINVQTCKSKLLLSTYFRPT